MISGISQLYFGTSIGKTFAFNDDIFSDAGNAIALKVRTKEYYMQPIDEDHQIQEVNVFSDEPQGTNFSISLDGGDYEYQGQIQGDEDPNVFKIWNHCNHFSLGLDELSTNNLKIKGFVAYYE